jgi:hypothetical protein
MLSDSVVSEIHRLLSEGRLSRRAIARQIGVSRGSVNLIANGRREAREDQPADKRRRQKRGLARRCRQCGGRVYLPCLLCRARAYQRRAEVARLLAAAGGRRQSLTCLSQAKPAARLKPADPP